MMNDDMKPVATSWRDVYDLVRDTRADIMVAVGNVDTKVTLMGERVTGIEEDRLQEKIDRQAEAKMASARNATAVRQHKRIITLASFGKGTIAIIVSIGALIVSAFGHASTP